MTTREVFQLIIENFNKRALSELKGRCEEMPFDPINEEIYTVTTALLARQVTLGIQFASAPQIWNNHSAPLFFRSMADVHITLEWIGAEPSSRAKDYIEHGLGQSKLQIEHLKKALEEEPRNDSLRKMIEAETEWINGQHLSALINVNVGSWTGKSIRQMADEVGILDFYNFVYMPFSQCTHSTWSHVGRYNVRRSNSPLHCYRFLPDVLEQSSNIEELILCAKYLDKTCNFFDIKMLKSEPRSNLRQWIISEISKNF